MRRRRYGVDRRCPSRYIRICPNIYIIYIYIIFIYIYIDMGRATLCIELLVYAARYVRNGVYRQLQTCSARICLLFSLYSFFYIQTKLKTTLEFVCLSVGAPGGDPWGLLRTRCCLRRGSRGPLGPPTTEDDYLLFCIYQQTAFIPFAASQRVPNPKPWAPAIEEVGSLVGDRGLNP